MDNINEIKPKDFINILISRIKENENIIKRNEKDLLELHKTKDKAKKWSIDYHLKKFT